MRNDFKRGIAILVLSTLGSCTAVGEIAIFGWRYYLDSLMPVTTAVLRGLLVGLFILVYSIFMLSVIARLVKNLIYLRIIYFVIGVLSVASISGALVYQYGLH